MRIQPYVADAHRFSVLRLIGNAGYKAKIIDWQFSRCLEKGPLVALNDQGEVMGFNGVMPIQVYLNGEFEDAAWSCDFMVHPKYRRSGIGRDLKAQLDQDWPILLALGISSIGVLALRRAGWRPSKGAKRFVRILKGKTHRYRALSKFQSLIASIFSLCRTAGSIEITTGPMSGLPNPSSIDRLCRKVLPDYPATVVRDASYFQWRYLDSPCEHHHVIMAHRDDELEALAVVQNYDQDYSLIDYLGPKNDLPLKRRLIQEFLCLARTGNTADCTTNDPELSRALRERGFLSRRWAALPLYIRDNRKDGVANELDWFVMASDSDGQMLRYASYRWGKLTASLWSEAELSESEHEWSRLLSSTNSDPLFMSWCWQNSWWRFFGHTNGLRLSVITMRNDANQLVAVLPFIVRRLRFRGIPTSRVEILGNLWQGPPTMRSEYLEPIIHPDWLAPATDKVLGVISQHVQFDDLVISDTPSTSTASRSLANAFRKTCYVRRLTRFPEDEARYILLPETFEQYVSSLGKHTRLRMYGRRNRLCKEAKVEVRHATTKDLLEYFSLLNRFHQTRWGQPAFADSRLDFHVSFATEMAKVNRLKLSKILVNDEPISVAYDIVAGTRQYNLQLGFDEKFGKNKFSPGIIHLGYQIQSAIENGCTEYDLLAGAGKAEHYKRRITNRGAQLLTVHIIKSPWRQFVYKCRDRISGLEHP